jgi:succinate dehydrogenase / fumarate reductase, membrane anchor subunit
MSQDKNGSPSVRVMQSPLGRAQGLGAAGDGASTWKWERVTSVALVPLSLWFVYVVLHLAHADYATTRAFIGGKLHAVLFLALIGSLFPHLALGLRAIIEDYVRGELCKFFTLFAVNAGCVLLALLAAISVLKLAI